MKIAIVGAGFSGSVLSSELARKGIEIDLYEKRNHIGGNCYTEIDKESGITLHKYGPHIFHTNNERVWAYMNNLCEMMPFVNRVKINRGNKVYSLPINLHTINQLFNTDLNPRDAQLFLQGKSDKSILKPISFEEQALSFIGEELYQAFFYGYTVKQWGIHPRELPASIIKRLPVRFNYDDNYFSHKYQGMPRNGYTEIFNKILSSDLINLKLSETLDLDSIKLYDHVFYTGPLDAWFDYEFGMLDYRTLDFEREDHDGDFQGCAVMNYADEEIPYTRISEHKHFAPWESHEKSVIFKEYSRKCGLDDIPYYPVRLIKDKEILLKYVDKAKKSSSISFLGRLGTYRYLDMDQTIDEALNAADIVISCINSRKKIPVFFNEIL